MGTGFKMPTLRWRNLGDNCAGGNEARCSEAVANGSEPSLYSRQLLLHSLGCGSQASDNGTFEVQCLQVVRDPMSLLPSSPHVTGSLGDSNGFAV
jgi:hypothetical protein